MPGEPGGESVALRAYAENTQKVNEDVGDIEEELQSVPDGVILILVIDDAPGVEQNVEAEEDHGDRANRQLEDRRVEEQSENHRSDEYEQPREERPTEIREVSPADPRVRRERDERDNR